MKYFQYLAGFGPKDFMVIFYIPAIGILLLGSLVIFALKRRGHPYSLMIITFPPAALAWYLYDRVNTKQVDRSQALVLAGVFAVVGVFLLASSSLIPEMQDAVNAMALFATIVAVCFCILGILQRNK
jgi:hypothetical protein